MAEADPELWPLAKVIAAVNIVSCFQAVSPDAGSVPLMLNTCRDTDIGH